MIDEEGESRKDVQRSDHQDLAITMPPVNIETISFKHFPVDQINRKESSINNIVQNKCLSEISSDYVKMFVSLNELPKYKRVFPVLLFF
jgi:hypothetical protein